MKKLYCVHVRAPLSLERAWEAFEQVGIEVAYGSEEEGKVELFLYLTDQQNLSSFPWIATFNTLELPPIDWNAQWATHGMDFRGGKVHISFESFGRKANPIELEPGPGFGDLSHPTTHLVLQLMVRFLDGQTVIDIGCGSGVLSLAAISMGSPFVYGIDIDSEAINHSRKNAYLNHVQDRCYFSLTEQLSIFPLITQPLVVMNMISSEQEIAWQSVSFLHSLPGLCLTSGIRKEERDVYVQQTKQWGWQIKEEIERDEWMGFCFTR